MHGPITEQMSSLVTAQLLFLESEDPERPINMYINRSVCIQLGLDSGMICSASMAYIMYQVYHRVLVRVNRKSSQVYHQGIKRRGACLVSLLLLHVCCTNRCS